MAVTDRRSLLWLLAFLLGIPLVIVTMFLAMMGGLAGSRSASGTVTQFAPSAFALKDIPAAYLRTYQQAGAAYGVGWEYLAAIGKIETDHGRSSAPGVHSGVNFANCCAGPMQFSIVGANGGTWGTYGVDANDDGKTDVYDPEDAIPGAASYLKASGAPADWDTAIFAYNHASWYVQDVKTMADRYRGQALAAGGIPAGSGESQALPPDAKWLQPLLSNRVEARERERSCSGSRGDRDQVPNC